jgi:hypothetical protein
VQFWHAVIVPAVQLRQREREGEGEGKGKDSVKRGHSNLRTSPHQGNNNKGLPQKRNAAFTDANIDSRYRQLDAEVSDRPRSSAV